MSKKCKGCTPQRESIGGKKRRLEREGLQNDNNTTKLRGGLSDTSQRLDTTGKETEQNS